MGKKSIYICENEYGDDPCEFAIEGRRIPDTEVTPDIDGKPRCPGKTSSGQECGSELVCIGGDTKSSISPVKVIAAFVVLIVLGAGGYWILGSGGTPIMKVEPASITFPRAEAGAASANLQILNSGDGELIIERIEASSPLFSTSGENLHIEPNNSQTLMVHFRSASSEMTQGELMLYNNSQDSPVSIRLIANQDPWRVYRKLEKSSKILSME